MRIDLSRVGVDEKMAVHRCSVGVTVKIKIAPSVPWEAVYVGWKTQQGTMTLRAVDFRPSLAALRVVSAALPSLGPSIHRWDRRRFRKAAFPADERQHLESIFFLRICT